MSQEDSVQDRYVAPSVVASYLGNEWGDVLFPKGHPLFKARFNPDTLDEDRIGRERIDLLHYLYRPGMFYREAADQIERWCTRASLKPRRVVDIGGSTGRLVYELHRRLTRDGASAEFVMVEPSRVFCDWASTLLGIGSGQVRAVSPGSTESEWRIPLPHLPSQPYFESVQAADVRKRVGTPDGISINCATAETLPRPDASFDLAVSLNVIDRHPSPRALIRKVAELVRPGGLMVLGTPFDFRVQFTPDRASWPRQVEELLPSGWKVIGGSELAYHLRLHQWDYTTFVCRMICATAPLGGPGAGHAANDR